MKPPQLIAAALIGMLTFTGVGSAQENLDEKTVTDAYVYLLGRAIVIRQEQTDLKEPGIAYNVIKYNPAGSADFVNPNLDVAYLEAWIAVDDNTPVVLEVPEVKGRYYTAQILDEWGEVITNINERNYPSHPFGKFVLVAPGSTHTAVSLSRISAATPGLCRSMRSIPACHNCARCKANNF